MTKAEKSVEQMKDITKFMLEKRMQSYSCQIREQMRLPKDKRNQRKIDDYKNRILIIRKWLNDNN